MKTVHTPRSRAMTIGLLTLMLGTLPMVGHAQVQSGSVSISAPAGQPGMIEKAYWEGGPAVTEILTSDSAGSFVETMAGALRGDAAEKALNAADLGYLAYDSRFPSGLRREGLAAVKQLQDSAKAGEQAAGKLDKLGKVLNRLNLFNTLVKALAYATEGDLSGAANVGAKELTKQLITGGAASLVGWIPGGQLAAPAAVIGAESWFGETVEPLFDKRAQEVMDKEYAEKYLNKPWMPATLVMDADGKVRSLPTDMYVEKGTGLVKRRSEAEQAAYEKAQLIKWKDGKALQKVMQDLADGKISKDEFDARIDNYRNRDFTKEWDPEAPLVVIPSGGTFSGSFSGNGRGSITLHIRNGGVSGAMNGHCLVSPCAGDAVVATVSGSVSDDGAINATLSGKFVSPDKTVGTITFGGPLSGHVGTGGASGVWSAQNKYGGAGGNWSASQTGE